MSPEHEFIMKRVSIILALLLLLPFGASAQFYAGPLGGKDIIVIDGPQIQKAKIHLKRYPGCDNQLEVFYIHTETDNDFDGYFRFFLGYDVHEAIETVKKLEKTLDTPVGTDASFTFAHAKECHIWVKESKKSGKLLVFKYMEDGGFVFIDEHVLSVMKDALEAWKHRR